MKPTPGIVTYRAVDDVPASRLYLAQFYVMRPTKPTDGSEPREVMSFLEIHFMGSTEEGVVASAEAWWLEEQRKEEAKRAPRKKKEPTDAP
jgi:hypothetical protein